MEQNLENSLPLNKEESPTDWDDIDDFNTNDNDVNVGGNFITNNADNTDTVSCDTIKENFQNGILKISKPIFNDQIKKNIKTREQDAVATLLSTFCESAEEAAENFVKQNIGFKDLSSLTKDDLKLLGIDDNEQQNVLEIFEELPKQAPNYTKLTKSEETKNYNNKIFSSNIGHLETMKTAISATNLKLKLSQMEDVIVPEDDEEEFASTYVLQALDELKRIIDEIDDRVALLEETIEEKTKERSIFNKILIATGITVISFAYLIWRKS